MPSSADAPGVGVKNVDPLKSVPTLTKNNFQQWYFRISIVLIALGGGLASHLGITTKQEDEDERPSESLLMKAYMIMVQTISSSLDKIIQNVKPGDALGLWQKITSHLKRSSERRVAHQLEELHTTRYSLDVDFDKFCEDLTYKVDDINRNGQLVSASMKRSILFNAVQDVSEFRTICTILEDELRQDPDGLTYEDIVQRMSNQIDDHGVKTSKRKEQHRAYVTEEKSSSQHEEQMKVLAAIQRKMEYMTCKKKYDPGEPCRHFLAGNCTYGDKCKFSHDKDAQSKLKCWNCGAKGKHSTPNCHLPPKNRQRANVACWNCSGPHLKRDCPELKKKKKPKSGEHAGAAEIKTQRDELFPEVFGFVAKTEEETACSLTSGLEFTMNFLSPVKLAGIFLFSMFLMFLNVCGFGNTISTLAMTEAAITRTNFQGS